MPFNGLDYNNFISKMKFAVSLAVALFLSCNIESANGMNLNMVASKKDDEDVDKNTPGRFKENSDDIFMRSMYRSYATELEEEDKKTGEKKKTGELAVTRGSAYQAGLEVLGTHKGLKGEGLMKYMETYFERAWNHYDVMQKGYIAVEMMPMLMRFLASDQLINIYGQQKQIDNFTFAVMPKTNVTLANKPLNASADNSTLIQKKANATVNATVNATAKSTVNATAKSTVNATANATANATVNATKKAATNATVNATKKAATNSTVNATISKNITQAKNVTVNATIQKNVTAVKPTNKTLTAL